MRHTISILVDNQSGVLSRIAGLFSARGFNIESLSVAETLEPDTSRITLVTSGNPDVIEQVTKRFNNMVNVIEVDDVTHKTRVERQMVLIRVQTNKNTRAEVLRIVDIFRASVVDVGKNNYMLELTGDKEKIGAFIELLTPLGIKEIARTGTVALTRDIQKNNKEN
ncbi:MAG: acetolactate synthase small subunit [Candidatus Dadabacteria bacterium]|nr:acetolactate synthase small subunit [Candidatus Dadabacteria bacterium]NIV41956.1 acetolactate synthase small subunit [Candidatus Dadabacteria bacterium]